MQDYDEHLVCSFRGEGDRDMWESRAREELIREYHKRGATGGYYFPTDIQIKYDAEYGYDIITLDMLYNW